MILHKKPTLYQIFFNSISFNFKYVLLHHFIQYQFQYQMTFIAFIVVWYRRENIEFNLCLCTSSLWYIITDCIVSKSQTLTEFKQITYYIYIWYGYDPALTIFLFFLIFYNISFNIGTYLSFNVEIIIRISSNITCFRKDLECNTFNEVPTFKTWIALAGDYSIYLV